MSDIDFNAFFDEMLKIAEDEQKKKGKYVGPLAASGTGAALIAGYGAHKGVRYKAKKKLEATAKKTPWEKAKSVGKKVGKGALLAAAVPAGLLAYAAARPDKVRKAAFKGGAAEATMRHKAKEMKSKLKHHFTGKK